MPQKSNPPICFDIKIRQFTLTNTKVSFSKTFDAKFALGEHFTFHTKEALPLRHLGTLLDP